MIKLNYNEAGTQINDEVIYGSTEPQKLLHDNFFDVQVWTGQNLSGTQLIEGTDYTLGDYDSVFQTYNSIIFSSTYNGTKLYITYKTKGDYVDAEDVNTLQGFGYFEGNRIKEYYGFNVIYLNNDSAPCYIDYEIYPVTIVNLLGKYGNFETDSNSDGAADGVVIVNATDYLLASGYQKAGLISSSALMSLWYLETPLLNYQHWLFLKFIYKNDSNIADLNLYNRYTNKSDGSYITGYYTPLELSSVATQKYDTTFTPSSGSNLCLRLIFRIQTVDDTNIGYLSVDKMLVVDLTEMGTLPPPLKEYFDNQVSNWEDLATTSNITAIDGRTQTGEAWLNELIPYVDSVASLGFAWGDVG